MSFQWMRRAVLALAPALALLLAACGSGTIESQLKPTRMVVFGDGMSDVGQAGARYTVNDTSINIWTQEVAASFGLGLDNAVSGGTSFATRNARVNTKPDAVGNSATPTVKEQIDSFIAAGGVFGPTDLIVVSGGTSDLIAEMAKVTSGAQTRDQMIANVTQAGRDLAAQVRRVVAAGGTHVIAVGAYQLGRSPWATQIGQIDFLTNASIAFNDALLVSMVDLGANVLYVDVALVVNLMTANGTSFNIANVLDPACTSIDPGPGIGTGPGQLNSALCTPATITPGADYNQFVFADRVYLAPNAQRQFGDFAFNRIHDRF
jgi:phospholipase/lecithinase/hemolysin